MKKWISVSVIALVWTNILAADPPRSAEEILKEFEAAKSPAFDFQQRENAEYVRKYVDARKPLENKRCELAWELYQSYPSHERVVELLLVRWENNMRLGETVQSLQEIGNFVRDHPDSPRIADVLYARADGALRTRPRPDTGNGKAFIEDFIRKLPQDERGADLLGSLASYSRKNEQRAIYRRIAADYAGTSAAKLAEGALRQLDGIGKPMELSFDDVVSGQPVSIKNLKGKVVVIHFWSTTCGPCIAEMPALRSAFTRYKEHGVEFIGVNLDHPSVGVDAVKECIAAKKLTWPQFYQGNGWESEFSTSWGINGIPTVFVVDRDGNLHSTEARGRLEFILPTLVNNHGP